MADGYQGGEVYIDIIPSFSGWDRASAANARRIGAEAGREFAQGFNANADIDIDIETDTAAAAAAGTRAGRAARAAAERETARPVNVNLGADAGRLRGELSRAIRAAEASLPRINVDANTSPAQRRTAELRRELSRLHAEVNVGLDAGVAMNRMRILRTELDRLSRGRHDIDIEVNTNASRAVAELAVLDTALRRNGSSAMDATNSFRAFSAIVLAVAGLGPLAIPAIGGMAAALAGIGPAATTAIGGIGPLAMAFSGLGKAMKAQTAVAEQAGQATLDSAKQARNAARAVADAERAVARAREQSARTAEDGAERVARAKRDEADAARAVGKAVEDQKRAEQGLAEALRDQKKAQTDLTAAREEGARQLEEAARKAKSAKLDVRQANLDLAEAQYEYNKIMAGAPGEYSSVERERAAIELEQAKQRLDEAKAANTEAQRVQKKGQSGGVENTDPVLRAKENLENANKRVVDSERDVRDATRAVTDAQRDAADAHKAVGAAVRDAGQANADAAQRIADAQRNLTQALEDQASGVEKLTGAQNNLRNAMAKLTPAGRDFVAFLNTLKPRLLELRTLSQNGILPGLQQGIETALPVLWPSIRKFVDGVSKQFGAEFARAGRGLTTNPFTSLFDSMAKNGPRQINQMSSVLGNLAAAFSNLLVAFTPLSLELGDGLVRLTDRFAKWSATWSKTEGFEKFVDWIRDSIGVTGRFLGAFTRGMTALGKALAPWGRKLAVGLTDMLNWLARQDPDHIRKVALAILSVVVGFQAFFGLKTLAVYLAAIFRSFGTLAGHMRTLSMIMRGVPGVIGGSTLAFVGLAVGLGALAVLLYRVSPEFRAFVSRVVDGAKELAGQFSKWVGGMFTRFQREWWPAIRSALVEMGAKLAESGGKLLSALGKLKPFFSVLGRVIEFILGAVAKALPWVIKLVTWAIEGIVDTVTGIINGVAQLVKGIIQTVKGVFDFFNNLIHGRFGEALDALGQVILGLFNVLVGAVKTVFYVLLARWIMGGWSVVSGLFGRTFGKLPSIFGEFVAKIGSKWRGLGNIFTTGYKKYIAAPLNSLGRGVKSLLDWFTRTRDSIASRWRGLGAMFTNGYKKYIASPLDSLGRGAANLLKKFTGYRDDIVSRWRGLGKRISRAYRDHISGPLGALTRGVEGVRDKLVKQVEKIGKAWAKVGDFFKKPIRTFIKLTVNSVLFKGLRAVAAAVGGDDKIKNVDLPKGFNTGGRVGGFSPHKRADNIPAWLTAGEFVLPVDAVQHYGTHVLEAMRRRRLPKNRLPAFASGGMVGVPQVRGFAWGGQTPPSGHPVGGINALIAFGRWLQSMGYRVSRGPGPFGPVPTGGHSKNSLHYSGRAIDVNSRPGTSAAEQRELDAIIPFAKQYGLRSIWRVAGHFNHAHFDIGRGKSFLGKIVDKFQEVVAKLGDLAAKPFEYLGKKIDKQNFGDEKLRWPALTRKAAGWALKGVANKIKSMMDRTKNDSGEDTGEPPYPANGSVVDKVRAVAKGKGWGEGSQWDALSWIISKESSWNPNAQNPKSTAYGLFQLLNGTWASTGIAKSSDPGRQAMAGTRYIANRYGNPVKAKAFWQSHNWYADGGMVTPQGRAVEPPKVYDQGGWLMPGQMAINLSQRPEPILTGREGDTFRKMVQGQIDGGSIILNVTQLPGEDGEALARRVERRIEHRRNVATRAGR